MLMSDPCETGAFSCARACVPERLVPPAVLAMAPPGFFFTDRFTTRSYARAAWLAVAFAREHPANTLGHEAIGTTS